jgi:hypothetical protein
VRNEQYERERKAARDAFQRESILALQVAISDVIGVVYEELDRMIAVSQQTRTWPTREWENPTAAGWSAAVLRLELSRARVFDSEIRSLADELRNVAGDSVWANSVDVAKQHSQRIEPLQIRFNEAVTRILPLLY